MSEKPIIFNGPMVRAILEGRKTMTRRALKPQPVHVTADGPWYMRQFGIYSFTQWHGLKYQTDDVLWVRESFSGPYPLRYLPPADWPSWAFIWYWADGNPSYDDWTKPKPSIHMPKWAARIWLRVTGVKVERLQELSEDDAIAEGSQEPSLRTLGGKLEQAALCERQVFARLWDHINGKGAWEKNPYVAAITFERIERP